MKAQVDYIKERVPNAEVFVHPHTGEAGAIGAAMETLRVVKRKGASTFIGLDAGDRRSSTRRRTTRRPSATSARTSASARSSTRRRPDGSTSRYIAGFSCEKGTVESKEAMLALVAERKKIGAAVPEHGRLRGEAGFMHFYNAAPMPEEGSPIKDIELKKGVFGMRRVEVTRPFKRSSKECMGSAGAACASASRACSTSTRRRRSSATYFEALGIPKQNVVFSDETTEEMWVEGGKYGSIDPCYPRKVAQAHIHNLLFHQHTEKKPLKYIFFPILTHVTNFVADTMDNACCPIVAGAPEVMKAAFTKEVDFFATRGIEYLDPGVSFVEPNLMAKRMFETWGPRLGITEDENDLRLP